MSTATSSLTVTTPNEREISTQRIFDAPRDRVWRAMTEPALLAQWWGRGNPLDIERHDLEPGGRWRFVEHSAQGTFAFSGEFREVDAPARLVTTFGWDGAPDSLVQTVTLDDAGAGHTRVRTSSVFETTVARDGMLKSGMEAGMNQSYAALDRVLNAMPASPAR